MGDFLCVGGIGRLLMDTVAWCSCMRIRDYFNTKCFINKIKVK